MPIAEGAHEAIVTAAGREVDRQTFEVAGSFPGRFYKQPAYVLNAGGGAVVMWEETTYSARPVSFRKACSGPTPG